MNSYDMYPIQQSIDMQPPERDTPSYRRPRSVNREEYHSSPLRVKSTATLRKHGKVKSTGRLGVTDKQHVRGNRHVGGCCGPHHQAKPRPPASRSPKGIRKKKRTVIVSPSLRHE